MLPCIGLGSGQNVHVPPAVLIRAIGNHDPHSQRSTLSGSSFTQAGAKKHAPLGIDTANVAALMDLNADGAVSANEHMNMKEALESLSTQRRLRVSKRSPFRKNATSNRIWNSNNLSPWLGSLRAR